MDDVIVQIKGKSDVQIKVKATFLSLIAAYIFRIPENLSDSRTILISGEREISRARAALFDVDFSRDSGISFAAEGKVEVIKPRLSVAVKTVG